MNLQHTLFIFAASVVVFFVEIVIYSASGMREALHGSGLAMVTAYKFLWLMVMTAAAGFLAPVAFLLAFASGRKNWGWTAWILLVGLALVAFTALSFTHSKNSIPAAPAVSATPSSSVVATPSVATPGASKNLLTEKPAIRKIEDVIEWVDSKIERSEADKLHVALRFKNKSSRRIKELEYAFTFLDDKNNSLLSIDLREGVSIPPGLFGESSLDWSKAGFNDPQAFERLNENYSKSTLKVSVTLQKATLDDGSIAQA